MKKYALILLVAFVGFLYSCGDDKSTDPNSSAYACEMSVSGDVNLEFKTNDMMVIPPSEQDANAKITIKMTESNGTIHQLYMVLDGEFLTLPENESLVVDLSRGDSQATFIYNLMNLEEQKMYRVTEGILTLQEFSFLKAKGTFSFKANMIDNPELFINATNGKLNYKK